MTAPERLASAGLRIRAWICALALLGSSAVAGAAGTPVGTVVENTASLTFDLGGSPTTIVTNTTTLTVAERIDAVVVLQSPPVLVAANDTNQVLLFTVTNTGNGTETFSLAVDNAIVGDDFDPIAAVPGVFFDSDGSGDLTPADQAYTPGGNDPVLPADASVDILVVNDIPGGLANGEVGRSELSATSLTGTGAPGTVLAGLGDGGADAVIGTSGGASSAQGEYVVSDVQVTVVKAQAVADPFGGTEPVPGATITYTITVDVAGTGTATGSVFNDAIPTFASYVANSIFLNGAPLTDAIDADAGELDTSSVPTVVVRLGDLTLADGTQTVVFQVTID
ncbi:MAG: hypothetical protein ACE5F8_03260 [Woeseiaceae bacterium]